MEHRITGLIAAPHTPMREDFSVEPGKVGPYAAMLVRNGVSGAFVCGSTGESMSLTVAERQAVAEAWVEAAPEGFVVIVHVGHTALPDCRALAEHARRIGADAIALMPPVYFRPRGVEELVDFCARVAEAAPEMPFYYYHIPVLTGVRVPMAEFVPRAVERVGSFAGMKFTDEDLMDLDRCLRFGGGRLNVLFGRDQMLLSALVLGVEGAVGTTYNYAAPLYRGIMEAFAAGDLERARAQQSRAADLVSVMHRFGGLCASKAMMRLVGVDCGPCRPPVRTLSPQEERSLRAALEAVGFFEYSCRL